MRTCVRRSASVHCHLVALLMLRVEAGEQRQKKKYRSRLYDAPRQRRVASFRTLLCGGSIQPVSAALRLIPYRYGRRWLHHLLSLRLVHCTRAHTRGLGSLVSSGRFVRSGPPSKCSGRRALLPPSAKMPICGFPLRDGTGDAWIALSLEHAT